MVDIDNSMVNFYTAKKALRRELITFITALSNDLATNEEGKRFILGEIQRKELNDIVLRNGFSYRSLNAELKLLGLQYDSKNNIISKV
jgi:hypothetical protein